MFRNCIFTLLIILATCLSAHAAPQPVALFPRPKDVKFLSRPPLALEAGRVAIVVGSKASQPEQYAAETLQKNVKKRFAQEWPILADTSDLKGFKVYIALGQQSSNKLVDVACRVLELNPSEKFPVQDGYVLGVGASPGRNVAVVAGSNPRSVIFGQDTLFQLIAKRGNAVVLYPAAIRDWPSMPHRGRVCTGPQQFYSTEAMDAVAQARLNFIDMRYDKYGTRFDVPLERDVIAWDVKEAHRRGLLVYATVHIGVQPPDYDKVITKFQEFIDLGVDGLWPYLGDPGGEGRSGTSLELLRRIIELGKKHGMTGDLIHFTPGKKGYITIATNDNFAAAKVPGMAEALWFFAVKPTPESYADAAKLGIKRKYAWWNHWPRPYGGFTSVGNVNMRLDKPNVYSDLTPLQEAYENPSPQELAAAPEFVDGVIPWGGSVWLQESVASVLGWWAWSPESYDWQQSRRRMYDYLYGPDLVATAFELNDLLGELKSKVVRCGDEAPLDECFFPPLLRNESDRPLCRELIQKMRAPLEKLEQGAAQGTMIDRDRLEKYFFEPMRAELEAAKLIIDLPRPELWWKANENRILAAVREGDTVQALRWQADARTRVDEDVKKTRDMLDGVVNARNYGSSWPGVFEKRAGEAVYASSAIALDGELNEPAWSNAPKLAPFTLLRSMDAPENPGEAQVIYSDDALFIGLTFHEPHTDIIIAANTQHDSSVWADDSFEVFINPDGLGKPYYQFVANTLGAKYEALTPMGGEMDAAWNGEWDVKIAKKSDRWTAELRIPYTTIGVAKPEKDALWLCNFARHDFATARRAERGEDFQEVTAWGNGPAPLLHDTGKFRPVWFK